MICRARSLRHHGPTQRSNCNETLMTSMNLRLVFIFALMALVIANGSAVCPAKDITPPKVFLDKSPRIVAYQLGRLDDDRLLLVPRSTDDKKYIPVYQAIVGRPSIAAGIREESLKALAILRNTSIAAEVLSVVAKVEPEDRESRRLIELLTRLLLKRPKRELASIEQQLTASAGSGHSWLKSIGLAGLVTIDRSERARELAAKDEATTIAMLSAINQLAAKPLKVSQRPYAVAQFENPSSIEVQRAAIDALSRIPAETKDTYRRLIALVGNNQLRVQASRALMRLPVDVFDQASSLVAVKLLVEFAESTEPAKRTTTGFVDAMQLADRLLTRIPSAEAKSLRSRLREVAVRVIKIGTVEEEMRYDVPFFAVQAGRPVQILLENHDLMPHNLVVTAPGTLKAVAMAGLATGPDGTNGLAYVPNSPNVLAATELIAADSSTRLTFDAPAEPGEYPYVCTFPQHWYRMYGVMVVVEDLDAWNQNPVKPADPLGSKRSFVKAWTMDDFVGAFDSNLDGRTSSIGEKVFNEASCIGCHKIKGVGGAVGPDLTDIYPRWKSDHNGILREILDPSHKIDSKYAMQTILTIEGKTLSGIVVDETDETLALLTNPESKEPQIILQDDIELIKRSSTSMMPKALMDQFTKEEILELMAYLKAAAPSQ